MIYIKTKEDITEKQFCNIVNSVNFPKIFNSEAKILIGKTVNKALCYRVENFLIIYKDKEPIVFVSISFNNIISLFATKEKVSIDVIRFMLKNIKILYNYTNKDFLVTFIVSDFIKEKKLLRKLNFIKLETINGIEKWVHQKKQ